MKDSAIDKNFDIVEKVVSISLELDYEDIYF